MVSKKTLSRSAVALRRPIHVTDLPKKLGQAIASVFLFQVSQGLVTDDPGAFFDQLSKDGYGKKNPLWLDIVSTVVNSKAKDSRSRARTLAKDAKYLYGLLGNHLKCKVIVKVSIMDVIDSKKKKTFTDVFGIEFQITEDGLDSLQDDKDDDDDVMNASSILLLNSSSFTSSLITIIPPHVSSFLLSPSTIDDAYQWLLPLNLHTRDLILLPICDVNHWLLLVVDVPKSLILYLDSWNDRINSDIIKSMSNLLHSLFPSKNFQLFFPSSEIPIQGDPTSNQPGNNCGVHVISWLRVILTQNPTPFSDNDMSNVRSDILQMINFSTSHQRIYPLPNSKPSIPVPELLKKVRKIKTIKKIPNYPGLFQYCSSFFT